MNENGEKVKDVKYQCPVAISYWIENIKIWPVGSRDPDVADVKKNKK